MAEYRRCCIDIFWHLQFSPARFSPVFSKSSNNVRIGETKRDQRAFQTSVLSWLRGRIISGGIYRSADQVLKA